MVAPVKLLIGALEETVFSEKLRFRLARERHMGGRGLADTAERNEAARQRGADLVLVDAAAEQQARPRRRRERNRSLKFWIIAPAGALIGVGPAAVEHV